MEILLFGVFFGLILLYAKLNRFDTISGMALLTDLTVAKTMAVAIGTGAIFISFEIGLGLASYHTKPVIVGGLVLGGLIFGAGMAILGYCPGTLAISLGEGAVDAFIGIIGGLAGGLVYTLVLPQISPLLGPDLGKLSLSTLMGHSYIAFYLLVVIIGAGLISFAFWMHRKEQGKDYKWLASGVALAVLNAAVMLHLAADRPIGASTFYPYVADFITGTTEGEYFHKIKGSGHWELIFLAGAFLAALIVSLLRKNFRLTLIHSNWKKYKGELPARRIVWAFVGGFILIFGARMAGGCTSGHILSGGMQLAVSSFAFAIFTFVGLLLTARIFYK
ncbi:MAG: YeeE/YedE family protein [Cyclobacteriaceae bacterium]|nr:YeeE/YedE family protein [Cyclobacteriaceae bacterium]